MVAAAVIVLGVRDALFLRRRSRHLGRSHPQLLDPLLLLLPGPLLLGPLLPGGSDPIRLLLGPQLLGQLLLAGPLLLGALRLGSLVLLLAFHSEAAPLKTNQTIV